MPKIITVAFPKGGTAKTTTAAHLLFALPGRKLGIDIDAQSNLSQIFKTDNPIFNSAQLFSEGKNYSQLPQITPIQGIELIPATQTLYDIDRITEDTIAAAKNFVSVVKSYPHDYVVIDCPPGQHLPTLAAVLAADVLVIPVATQDLCVEPMRLFMQFLASAAPSTDYVILPTLYNQGQQQDDDILKRFLIQLFQDKCFYPILRKVTVGALMNTLQPCWEHEQKESSRGKKFQLPGEVYKLLAARIA